MAMPSVVATSVAALLTLGTASAGALAESERSADNHAAPASALTSPGPTDAGGPVRPAQAERRVDVTMKEMAFLPDTIDVKVGETITFVFTNSGQAVHEALIGDKATQEEHARQMREQGPGQHEQSHHGSITVQPGQTGTIRYTFDQPGALEIGCHQPNHYESGMKAIINAD
ncbi:MAG: cupredoxin domain-containing protein [Actinomycetota bacterium]|jgi:uncharacterized cupredoxin-like copper-binding protein